MTTKLIKDGKHLPDSWHLLGVELTAEQAREQLGTLDGQDVIVSLALWTSEAETIKTRQGKTGVWLNSHEIPAALGKDVNAIPLIALHFPEFKDGRPFTSARELRQRMGYTGELRAIGDVLRDQLFFMLRCGFNAFVLREDQDLDSALTAFKDFKDAYQAAIDQPVPLFRRRQ